MPFISSSEAKNANFINGENLNFLFIIYNFKCDRFFVLYDFIHFRTLRPINDDISECAMSAKTKTTGAGVEKVKISANPDNFMTKIFLVI